MISGSNGDISNYVTVQSWQSSRRANPARHLDGYRDDVVLQCNISSHGLGIIAYAGQGQRSRDNYVSISPLGLARAFGEYIAKNGDSLAIKAFAGCLLPSAVATAFQLVVMVFLSLPLRDRMGLVSRRPLAWRCSISRTRRAYPSARLRQASRSSPSGKAVAAFRHCLSRTR